MKRVVVVCVLLSLCFGVVATEPVRPSLTEQVDTLWGAIVLIMLHLIRISDAACADTAISPQLRQALEAAADSFTQILEEAGIPVRRIVLPGSNG